MSEAMALLIANVVLGVMCALYLTSIWFNLRLEKRIDRLRTLCDEALKKADLKEAQADAKVKTLAVILNAISKPLDIQSEPPARSS